MKKFLCFFMIICLILLSIINTPITSVQATDNGLSSPIHTYGKFNSYDENGYVDSFTTSNEDYWYNISFSNVNVNTIIYLSIKETNSSDKIVLITAYGEEKKLALKLKKLTKYQILVYRYELSKTGDFKLEISQVKDDISNDKNDAKVIKLRSDITKSIDYYGDVDYFKFTTSNYDTWYNLNFTNNNSEMPFMVFLLDKNEAEIYRESVYSSEDLHKSLNLEENSTYYIKVCNYDNKAIGKYSVGISELSDDVPDYEESAKLIMTDKSINNTLNVQADKDCYKLITSKKDSWYCFEFKNININTLVTMYIYDEKNTDISKLVLDQGKSTDKYIKLKPNKTYYIKIVGNDEMMFGKYHWKVSEIQDDATDTIKNSTKILLNRTYLKKINVPFDADYFNFKTNKKNTNYQISVSNKADNKKVIVEIVNSSNKLQGQFSVSGKKSKTSAIKLNKNEKYYLCVRGQGAKGSYQIKILVLK